MQGKAGLTEGGCPADHHLVADSAIQILHLLQTHVMLDTRCAVVRLLCPQKQQQSFFRDRHPDMQLACDTGLMGFHVMCLLLFLSVVNWGADHNIHVLGDWLEEGLNTLVSRPPFACHATAIYHEERS